MNIVVKNSNIGFQYSNKVFEGVAIIILIL